MLSWQTSRRLGLTIVLALNETLRLFGSRNNHARTCGQLNPSLASRRFWIRQRFNRVSQTSSRLEAVGA